MTLAERLGELGERVGSVGKLADQVGIPRNTMYTWATGDREPRASDLRRIAERAPCDLLWLLTGVRSSLGFAEDGAVYVSGPSTPDLVFVPRLDIRASAGPGALVETEAADGEIAFRRDLVRSLGVSSPGALRVLAADGDSMEPVIRPGDLLLVDTGIDHVVSEGIYVVLLEGAVLVKRLTIDPKGAIVLVSENPRMPAMTIPRDDRASIHIAGRVVRVIRAL